MRIRAAQSLAKLANPSSVAALCSGLVNQPNWWVRKEIASSLAVAGGEASLGALKTALGSEKDLRVRTAIVKALGFFRGQVDDVLLPLATNGDPSLFAEAESAAILGRHQSPHAEEACKALLGRNSWGDKWPRAVLLDSSEQRQEAFGSPS